MRNIRVYGKRLVRMFFVSSDLQAEFQAEGETCQSIKEKDVRAVFQKGQLGIVGRVR